MVQIQSEPVKGVKRVPLLSSSRAYFKLSSITLCHAQLVFPNSEYETGTDELRTEKSASVGKFIMSACLENLCRLRM